MKTIALVLLSLSALAGASQPAPDLPRAEVVIRNISVLDVNAAAWLPHRDVIIRNGRIAAVQPTGSPLPPAKFTINGDGKFAVPGFFDNRVHLKGFDRTTAGQFVAYGVTSVWDRGTDATRIEEWRRDISYGKFMGPRIVRADAAAPGLQNEPCIARKRRRSDLAHRRRIPRRTRRARAPIGPHGRRRCCGARRWTPRPFMAVASISVRSSRARSPT